MSGFGRMNQLARHAFLTVLTVWVGGLAMMVDAASPVVSNVTASQRAGSKLVDIYYDVADADGDVLTVSLEISDDAGRTYVVPATSLSGTGFGAGVLPGSRRHIVWNAGTDWNWRFSANMRFRVVACDPGGEEPVGMVLIPAGSYLMGDSFSGDGGSWGDELPQHSVFVSDFYLDRFEVTQELWDKVRAWGNDHGYDLIAGEGKGPDHPVHSVSWYDVVKWCNARSEMERLTPCYFISAAKLDVYRSGAIDFGNDCVRWDANGYRLPTEAEWEKAARGGLEGKRFPWGDTISHSQANYYSDSDYSYDVSATRGDHPDYDSGGSPFTSPVGSFAPNGYGSYDMAGNVWEWCWDRWDGGWYGQSAAIEPNPKGPNGGSYRVLRGGSWYDLPFSVRCASRIWNAPDIRLFSYGFRCARGQF
ncbi:MAG: formylglycine-generating enzyme family protein [Verrucomicrobiota bacterium]|jgi:formylglycine-generating enzyme required for sulfatase activity